eukprot:scaffold58376_cov27-Prasinocladus_malaysianus.AAC.2
MICQDCCMSINRRKVLAVVNTTSDGELLSFQSRVQRTLGASLPLPSSLAWPLLWTRGGNGRINRT